MKNVGAIRNKQGPGQTQTTKAGNPAGSNSGQTMLKRTEVQKLLC